MSNYWKQSLVIGGIYWLLSLLLELGGSWELLLVDLVLSLLLLLFLIPMNKLVPIKRIDNLINAHPVATTMLASVGWLPYFTALLVIVASIAAIAMHADTNEENLVMIMKVVINVGLMRKFVAVVVSFVALVLVLVYGKSIAGQLDDHYKIVAKNKKETSTKVAETPKVVEEKVVAKAAVAKKPAKKVAEKKVAVKATAKKTTAKKTAHKKETVKKAAPKKAATKKTALKKVVKK